MDQGSNKNHSPAYNFTPTVTKFCVMWEGLSLPHDTKFGNCRCKIVDSRSFHSWSLIHGLRWSGLIKVGPALLWANLTGTDFMKTDEGQHCCYISTSKCHTISSAIYASAMSSNMAFIIVHFAYAYRVTVVTQYVNERKYWYFLTVSPRHSTRWNIIKSEFKFVDCYYSTLPSILTHNVDLSSQSEIFIEM